jgi:FtsP/CotA-like multicopper oxidase with cupredoxin domain
VAQLTRRSLLAGSLPALGLGAALATGRERDAAFAGDRHARHAHGGAGGHAAFRGGEVDHRANGFDPHHIVRDFDWGHTRRLASGRVVREWTLIAAEKEIEVAPGVRFTAWAYNGRVPGPTLRCREGERLRITLINGSSHDHTIHFHGIHRSPMDGVPGLGAGLVRPGGRTVYEFDALPFGVHLYHCHVRPLADHIAKGLYGAFIVDPKAGRPDADELVMVMNGFDTNFDRSNEIYAANSIGFAYMDRPIRLQRGEPARIYLVNVLEHDLVNSFHLHGNVFHWYPTGTSLTPSELTDTVMLCQGQRGIVETTFDTPGMYMFHAHQSEFTELGWQGFFNVCDGPGGRVVCDLRGGAS